MGIYFSQLTYGEDNEPIIIEQDPAKCQGSMEKRKDVFSMFSISKPGFNNRHRLHFPAVAYQNSI